LFLSGIDFGIKSCLKIKGNGFDVSTWIIILITGSRQYYALSPSIFKIKAVVGSQIIGFKPWKKPYTNITY